MTIKYTPQLVARLLTRPIRRYTAQDVRDWDALYVRSEDIIPCKHNRLPAKAVWFEGRFRLLFISYKPEYPNWTFYWKKRWIFVTEVSALSS